MAFHISPAEFAALVQEAIASLPPQFAAALEEVLIEIKPRPSREQLRSVGLADDELLLGLYVGRPMTERSVQDGPALPDKVEIFQEDCELACDSREQLVREVRITVLHELGHHFGMDEDDLEALGYG
ncbi:MAG TPA: metallopeptidase family protein [Tepidisphaeraceae bacterium]|nr:metallopeptidase family protein [Tepidisphaeraceae bacterium]